MGAEKVPVQVQAPIQAMMGQVQALCLTANALGQMGVGIPVDFIMFSVRQLLERCANSIPVDAANVPPEAAKLQSVAIAMLKTLRDRMDSPLTVVPAHAKINGKAIG